MITRNTHSNKSIDDILQSINDLITSKVKNNIDESEVEDELCLTEVISDSEDRDVKLRQESRAQTVSILEDFIETAETLNQVPSENCIKGGINNDNSRHSVEELVIQMLEPQIKSWLDNNLPTMVKQVVSDEIKSIVANIRKYKN